MTFKQEDRSSDVMSSHMKLDAAFDQDLESLYYPNGRDQRAVTHDVSASDSYADTDLLDSDSGDGELREFPEIVRAPPSAEDDDDDLAELVESDDDDMENEDEEDC
jgi:hypothetical protein